MKFELCLEKSFLTSCLKLVHDYCQVEALKYCNFNSWSQIIRQTRNSFFLSQRRATLLSF